jgi:UDP-GlcNAc:undecaprenyl-phosphate GlcNAc-1-phosphate transferase
VIALSANTVNLADLRPGRALKVGFVLLAFALLSTLVLCARSNVPVGGTILAVTIVGVLLGGPLLAMWPYDVSERGMLGDGGANAIGALLGYVIFVGLAPAASAGSGPALAILGIVAGLLLLVNGLSERYSYSEFIERSAVLRWLDRLGRPTFEDGSDEPGLDEL